MVVRQFESASSSTLKHTHMKQVTNISLSSEEAEVILSALRSYQTSIFAEQNLISKSTTLDREEKKERNMDLQKCFNEARKLVGIINHQIN